MIGLVCICITTCRLISTKRTIDPDVDAVAALSDLYILDLHT